MRIGIADPQARVRFSLRVLLEQQEGWIVCGEAANYHELFDLLRTASPDLLLVDLNLPDSPATRVLPLLRTVSPEVQIVAMSGRQELERTAITAGADAFACKAEPAEKLLTLLRYLQGRNAAFLTRTSE